MIKSTHVVSCCCLSVLVFVVFCLFVLINIILCLVNIDFKILKYMNITYSLSIGIIKKQKKPLGGEKILRVPSSSSVSQKWGKQTGLMEKQTWNNSHKYDNQYNHHLLRLFLLRGRRFFFRHPLLQKLVTVVSLAMFLASSFKSRCPSELKPH